VEQEKKELNKIIIIKIKIKKRTGEWWRCPTKQGEKGQAVIRAQV
jgi:hypothetical protein